MSAFGEASFKASVYASARPEYPSSLYNAVTSYFRAHNSDPNRSQQSGVLLDIGCGPGKATQCLAEIGADLYGTVIGIDPSEAMIEEAKRISNLSSVDSKRLQFYQGSDKDFATKIFSTKSSCCDTIVSAQAAHWFQYPQFTNDAHTLLKPHGTLAIWGYSDHIFVDYPKASDIFFKYCYDEKYMGPYWEQPGRNKLRDLYSFLDLPTDKFYDIKRYTKNCKKEADSSQEESPFRLVLKVPFQAVMEYMHTFSAYHSWKKYHDTEPDVSDICTKEIMDNTDLTLDKIVTIEWSTVLILASKRA